MTVFWRILFALELFLGGLQAMSAQSPSPDSARVLLRTADSLFNVFTPKSLREAIRLRGLAANIFHAIGDKRGEGEARSKAGATWLQLGEFDSAKRPAWEAFPLRLEGGDTAGALRSLSVLGAANQYLGFPDSSILVRRQAYRLAEITGDPVLMAQPAQNIGALFSDLGQVDSAMSWMHRTIELSRRAGDLRGEGDILNNEPGRSSARGRFHLPGETGASCPVAREPRVEQIADTAVGASWLFSNRYRAHPQTRYNAQGVLARAIPP